MDSLKNRLTDYYVEREADFDPGDTEECLRILSEQDEELSKLGKWDNTILQRLVDDDDLLEELRNREVEIELDEDPFADF